MTDYLAIFRIDYYDGDHEIRELYRGTEDECEAVVASVYGRKPELLDKDGKPKDIDPEKLPTVVDVQIPESKRDLVAFGGLYVLREDQLA